MSQKLTLRAVGSVESTISASYLDETDEEPDSPGRGVFRGVRRGFKKLGSLSRKVSVDEQFNSRALDSATFPTNHSSEYHARLTGSFGHFGSNSLEKPLPLTPKIPLQYRGQTYSAPETPETPKAFSMGSRMPLSRTSTMDSVPLYNPGASMASYTSDNGESSLRVNDQDGTSRTATTPRSSGMPSAGPSPGQPRSATSAASAAAIAAANPSTHLSGLMCNVHRTTGREPHARVGATTTILGDKLYVFGGRVLSRSSPVLTNDLYELDLISRHWTKLECRGQLPPPRYFHSVCPLGDTKLVCYGGMSPADSTSGQSQSSQGPEAQPEVVVMSDVYVFDAPSRTWSHVSTTDTPQGRYAHCATILPSSATYSAANAHMSSLHHNPGSSNPNQGPNQGSIGISIDTVGGAEMIIVGGQDSANHYIEQISVFNLRSLKWTSTSPLGKSCGAYRSVVAPVPNYIASRIGRERTPVRSEAGISQEAREAGSSMLIYSNYNFLDVKLELQIRSTDGTLSEKSMSGSHTPPGLRFPNGGVIDTNFVVSGTYLTSSKQEYALWALDLRTLTWSRIDAGGSVFSQGSWNRGILWNRRNTFVILGNRKRSLVEDYNHRRLNFSNVCMVELEAFGLYDNPRKTAPMSGFVSASAPSYGLKNPAGHGASGGRPLSKAAEELGAAALSLRELADMDILAVGGERIPVNSRIVARRWGPYFVQLLREGAATQDGNDTSTLRHGLPSASRPQHNPRSSSITITPSMDSLNANGQSRQSVNKDDSAPSNTDPLNPNQPSPTAPVGMVPTPQSLSPSSRPRTLYLPHTYLTLKSLLYFLYTASLPPTTSDLSTPQILCSLLQLARPYRIEGLVEAVIERLHGVLDSRNAAAVFNAAAMAAGGGRGISGSGNGFEYNDAFGGASTLDSIQEGAASGRGELAIRSREQQGGLRINTSFSNLATGMRDRSNTLGTSYTSDTDGEEEPMSAISSVASSVSGLTDSESDAGGPSILDRGRMGTKQSDKKAWDGDISCVIGLQKRGLRGLMEGRRLRERGMSLGQGNGGAGSSMGQQNMGQQNMGQQNMGQQRLGLGIA